MLNRSQMRALLLLRRHGGNIFAVLPRDLLVYIAGLDNGPDSKIVTLLHHIAYGDLQAAKKMLDDNARLVLEAGHVETPSGLKVMHTTPLECALGAGDPEMAEMIAPFFEKFEGGVKEREEQYARYRPHIERMLNQPGYDFKSLLDLIIQSSSEDITAALQHELSAESDLYQALQKFRADFTPGKMKVGMHFNYQDLRNAFAALDQEWDKLHDGDNYDKNLLFCLQVIGFVQRSLPAVDRQVYAQSLYEVTAGKIKNQRSFKFQYSENGFPVTAGDVSLTGLGFDYWIRRSTGWTSVGRKGMPASFLGNLCGQKTLDLQNLCGHIEKRSCLGVLLK